MPLDETLAIADEIKELRRKLAETRAQLTNVTGIRGDLIIARDALLEQIDERRAALRLAAVDA